MGGQTPTLCIRLNEELMSKIDKVSKELNIGDRSKTARMLLTMGLAYFNEAMKIRRGEK